MLTNDINTLNKQFIENLKEKLPEGISVAQAVMDSLYLSKEAVYRRLRGDVPFTFTEIVTLSQKYDISIDTVSHALSPKNIRFEMKYAGYSSNIQDMNYDGMQRICDIMKSISSDTTSEVIYTSNRFPLAMYPRFYNLSKFHTLKWLYLQEYHNQHTEDFHLIEYPEKLHLMKCEIANASRSFATTYLLLDNMVIQSIVNDMKYFQRINLISREEDIKKFKEELHELLHSFEINATTGLSEKQNKVYIYLSNINIDSTYCCLKGNNHYYSMIGAFTMNYLTSNEHRAFETVRKWAFAQKKVSTLISESGEVQRIRFFDKQHKIVDTL